jgi:hypothetical protein
MHWEKASRPFVAVVVVALIVQVTTFVTPHAPLPAAYPGLAF